MTFEIEKGSPTVFRLQGAALGGPDGLAFSSALSEVLADGATTILVDLVGVELMNSSGLGMLVAASRDVLSSQGALALCGANDKILELMAMTRLDSVFKLFDSQEEAIKALLASS